MNQIFIEKFGISNNLSVFGNQNHNAPYGVRKQPCGFTKTQVLATMLDPRTKHLYGVSDKEKPLWINLLIEECIRLYKLESNNINNNNNNPTNIIYSYADEESNSFLESFEKSTTTCYIEEKNESQSRQNGEDELRRLKSQPLIALKQCPLRWWKERKCSFPMLSKVARIVLAIPATSADAGSKLFKKQTFSW